MGQTAADGAPVTNLNMADEAGCIAQQRPTAGNVAGFFEGALACGCANAQFTVFVVRKFSSLTLLRSTKWAGRSRRKFISGTKLCPPANGRASSPNCASKLSASSRVVGS